MGRSTGDYAEAHQAAIDALAEVGEALSRWEDALGALGVARDDRRLAEQALADARTAATIDGLRLVATGEAKSAPLRDALVAQYVADAVAQETAAARRWARNVEMRDAAAQVAYQQVKYAQMTAWQAIDAARARAGGLEW